MRKEGKGGKRKKAAEDKERRVGKGRIYTLVAVFSIDRIPQRAYSGSCYLNTVGQDKLNEYINQTCTILTIAVISRIRQH
jgi:hypothetical protein